MDFSLSFLDEYISDALEAGALPYRVNFIKEAQQQSTSGKSIITLPSHVSFETGAQHQSFKNKINNQ